MSKITLTDSVQSALVKMADGNPGAVGALVDLLNNEREDGFGGLGSVLFLDTLEIYGTDIYILWSDICQRDVTAMINVLKAVQTGKFSSVILKDACSRQDRTGKDLIPTEILTGEIPA